MAAATTKSERTVADAIKAYRARRGKVSRTTDKYLVRMEAEWGLMPLSKVTAEFVNEWLDGRLAEVSSPTARRELNGRMVVLNLAEARGWCDLGGKVEKPLDGEPRLRWLTDTEVERLLKFKELQTDCLIRFLVNTGARIGEALELTWADVDVGQVTLRTRKRRGGAVAERRVPLNADAKGALVAVKVAGAGPKGRVFWQWASVQAASYWLDKAAKVAGVDDFSPHDLRRTFATRLLVNGVSPRVVADLLGHTSLAMVMRYMQVPDAERERAVALIEA